MSRIDRSSIPGLGLAGLVLLMLAAMSARADVRLPKVFGSNMVLQRDIELPVWGWADAGEEVAVTLTGVRVTTKAGSDGKWSLRLPAMKAGGPHRMGVSGKNKIKLDNILVGEVWVCSGQSNMKWPVIKSNHSEQEIAAEKQPKIRLFHISRLAAIRPQDDVDARWQECLPKTISDFSAVGYFFGRSLHEKLGVPIGLIETAWGGTRIEPWTPPVGFRSVPKLKALAESVEAQSKNPNTQNGRQTPTHLYNGMAHPILPFAIRGAIWYQGESNLGEGMLYHEKMKALIRGWRSVWKQGEFPFYFVQLAPFRYGGSPSALPEIWEAQTATLTVPNTGMAVITDIGNLSNIHPQNKQDVGKRLALWTLAKTYGHKNLVYSGPLYRSMTVKGDTIRLTFHHAEGGLRSRDGKPLSHFQIAGKDGKFVHATADIQGASTYWKRAMQWYKQAGGGRLSGNLFFDTLIVHAQSVPKPTAVRFGWDQLAEPNLINKEGLPASPFRTHGPAGE